MAGAYTVDASVFVNAARRSELGYETSSRFLSALTSASFPFVEPTLLLTEVAAALARADSDRSAAQGLIAELTGIPHLVFVSLDLGEARRAAGAAADLRLRASDAVYVAVARRYGSTLVSLDQQQLERAAAAVRAVTPGEALASLAG